jgi:GMP synthase-like glutamine amidotransferase
LKVGILETGAPPKDLQGRFGRYPAMFRQLLGEDTYDWASFDAHRGEYPATPEDCAAYLITGSPAGAYDADPWVGRLIEFLRAARGRAALVGVCFGHQVMAQAFGGKVIKSPKGWGIGLHRYTVMQRTPWMDGEDVIAVSASHQDQVVEPPPGAVPLAGSDFCPFGMLEYAGERAVSIQLHPEFAPDYARALIETRLGNPYPEPEGRAAIASLGAPDDRQRVGRWIDAFLARAGA